MPTHRHVCLLVEDDLLIAAVVIQLLRTIGYDVIHVTSLEEAKGYVDAGEFCFMIVDLGILPQKDAAKADIELGYMLIDYTRERYPRRGEDDTHLLPIIVMSANDEHRFTRAAFRRGVDDFLKKPLSDNQVSLKDVVSECLRKSGRKDHEACADVMRRARGDGTTVAPAAPTASSGVRLAITGRTEGNRCEISLNDASVFLPNRKFMALLALVDGRMRSVDWLDEAAFGGDMGHKAISELQQAVVPYLPTGVRLAKNNRSRGYRLGDEIILATINVAPLAEHDDARIRKLALSVAGKGTRAKPKRS
jgi:CheY-like chemotaxis protein